ncbi:hypothetical protein ACIQAL_00615 [Pseudomonas sp. NPDC088368]|jgi:hypothetical protein|uniref:hypothetical protein n=1 Tax=Pseudomonas sp. NPDC088368 TaxID=3364453 RepID=UPI0037F2AE09
MEQFSMDSLTAFLALHRVAVAVILITMVLMVAIKIWWAKVSYFYMNVAYTFPALGRISRWASKPPITNADGWMDSETRLCADYYAYYQELNKSPDFYDKCRDYLNKVHETGRREKGFLMWMLIIGLIFFEAVGFAYVLAPFMVQNISANVAGMLAWFTAFLLSVAAVFFTEMAGREMHHSSLITKIRTWYEQSRTPRDLEADTKVDIDNTYRDDDEPNYLKVLNRTDHNARVTPKYTWTTVCLIYVLAIAVGAFVIRNYSLKSMEVDLVSNPDVFSQTQGASGKLPDSPFELPAESVQENQAADHASAQDKMEAIRAASLTTYIILSVIFLGIQGVGIVLSNRFSFAGKQSGQAWHYTRGFNNAEEFAAHFQNLRERVARDAQAKLTSLQSRLANRITTSGHEREHLLKGFGHRNFDAYVGKRHEDFRKSDDSRLEQERLRREQIGADQASARARARPLASAAPAEPVVSAAIETPQPAVAPVKAGLGLDPDDFDDLTDFDDDELTFLAGKFHVTLDQLKKVQKLQRMAAKAGRTQQEV